MANKKSATVDLAELIKCVDEFDLVIMGDRSVGKSCLTERFVSGKFEANTHKTVSISVDSKLEINSWNTNKIRLEIWDSPSIELFGIFNLPQLTRRIAHGIILVYDCTNQESFDNITNWIDMLDYNFSKTIPKLLVGNKSDLHDKKVVDYATAKKYADKLKIPLVETSVLHDTNVKLALRMMITKSCEKQTDKVQQKEELEEKGWQEMIQQTVKVRETVQQEKEQQKIIQRNRKLQEKEREKKERQEMMQRQREREEKQRQEIMQRQREQEEKELREIEQQKKDRLAQQRYKIIQQKREQRTKKGLKRLQEKRKQLKEKNKKEKLERQEREQHKKDRKYVMQLLIPVLKRFATNAPSMEKPAITAATEIEAQVGLTSVNQMETDTVCKVKEFHMEATITAQKTTEDKRAMSLLAKDDRSSLKKNALYERIIFRKMQQNCGETIAQYATRLKQQARICNFGTLLDEYVRDQILGTCRSAELTERFFDEGGELTLEKLLEVGTLMEGNTVDEQSTGEMENNAEQNENEDEENRDSDLDGESDEN